ncbi:MAG: hypothetical protein VB106_08400 [Clostridiaceae bacterium]|jgi:hypothetical protein|nr:hypothetical protein [Clostridiaceae bacterium]
MGDSSVNKKVISKDRIDDSTIDRNIDSSAKIDEYLVKLGFRNVTCIREKMMSTMHLYILIQRHKPYNLES